MTTTQHDILTRSMIQALRDDAVAHGDSELAEICRDALCCIPGPRTDAARQAVADAYNRARAADGETPFVEVCP